MMKTQITHMFDIELPVIGAPMFLVSGPELVAAVSNAGGLGTLPSLNARSGDEFDALLSQIESLTSHPYGINLVLKDNPRLEEDLELCFKHRVALLITSLGDPSSVVKRAHKHGVRVFCDVTTVRHAHKVANSGADGLIAVAAGAGGHAGRISPFVLLPWLVDNFTLPVVAAGGIADGRGLAAALSLGAQAAYVGTRLVASQEALASDAYKQLVLEGGAEDVEYTDEVTGVPCSFLSVSLQAMRRGEIGPDKRFKNIWSAGQDIALCKDIQPAAAIVKSMATQAQKVLETLVTTR